MQERNLKIDVARGIGIILVVLGHVLVDNSSTKIIYMFHMPLFFFITGMTMIYSYKKEITFKEWICNKAKGILIPYFIFLFISFIYWSLIERNIRGQYDISILSNFVNIFVAKVDQNLYSSNVVMWFLPCLFISEIIYYYIMKLNKGTGLVSVIILVIGLILCRLEIKLPWAVETAMIANFFIYIGYLFNKNSFIDKFHKLKLIFFIIAIIILGVCFYLENNINMLNQQYGNPILFILGAYSGIFITIICATLLKNFKFLAFLGRNSIIIMACHEPLKRVILKIISLILNKDINLMRESLAYSGICTLIIIAVLIPVIYIINRYLPLMIGKFKMKDKGYLQT